MEERFLELCRAQGREFCLVVSRLNDPRFQPRDLGSMMSVLQMMRAGPAAGLPALVVYKVYPGAGRRELVRGTLLANLRLRSLRDIVAAGDDYAVHNFLQTAGGGDELSALFLPMLGADRPAGPFGLPSAVVAPSLLFEELEIRKSGEEPEKTRIIPRPNLTPK